jgi:hypothetical protein
MYHFAGMRTNTWIQTAAGTLGGILGTAVIQKEMQLAGRLPDRLKPTQPKEDPGAFMVSQAERLASRTLSPETTQRATKGLHMGYGTFWGALLGLASSRLRMHRLTTATLAGAAMGAAVWAIGYAGWLPAVGLTPPVHRQGRGILANLAMHVGYGIAAALPVAIAAKLVRAYR